MSGARECGEKAFTASTRVFACATPAFDARARVRGSTPGNGWNNITRITPSDARAVDRSRRVASVPNARDAVDRRDGVPRRHHRVFFPAAAAAAAPARVRAADASLGSNVSFSARRSGRVSLRRSPTRASTVAKRQTFCESYPKRRSTRSHAQKSAAATAARTAPPCCRAARARCIARGSTRVGV